MSPLSVPPSIERKNNCNHLILMLGSNLGNRSEYLSLARTQIELNIGNINLCSSEVTSQAQGYKSSELYLNQALSVETRLLPEEVLRRIHQIENLLGRNRLPGIRYSDRTIDIDIIYYNNQILTLANLVIPHPQVQHRTFVLEPLSQIIPEYVDPKTGLNVTSMYEIAKKKLGDN